MNRAPRVRAVAAVEGRDGERGSATMWAAGATAAVLALVALVVMVGSAAVARHRAEAAADLASLAAAGRVPGGRDAACACASRVAERNRARLLSCRLDGVDALVGVSVRPGGVLGVFGPAVAHARAGPVRGSADGP